MVRSLAQQPHADLEFDGTDVGLTVIVTVPRTRHVRAGGTADSEFGA